MVNQTYDIIIKQMRDFFTQEKLKMLVSKPETEPLTPLTTLSLAPSPIKAILFITD